MCFRLPALKTFEWVELHQSVSKGQDLGVSKN